MKPITTTHPLNLLLTNNRIKVIVCEGQHDDWQDNEENRDNLNEETMILIINNILLYLEMGMTNGKEESLLVMSRFLSIHLFAVGWTRSTSRSVGVIQ